MADVKPRHLLARPNGLAMFWHPPPVPGPPPQPSRDAGPRRTRSGASATRSVNWLEADHDNLAGSLARFIGSTAYGPDSLREDFDRFRFLLGLTDGDGLFTQDEP